MKKITIYISLLIFVCAILAGCKKEEKAKDKETIAKTVVVAPVSRIDILRTITLTGTIKPIEDSLVSAEIAGSIVAKSVKLGDFVKKNHELAKIDEENYKKSFEQAEAYLKVAEASLEQNKATQEQLQKDKETNERLYQQNVVSKKVLDDITTKLAEINALVKLSEAKITEAEIARDIAKLNRDKTTVKSPLEKAYVANVSFEVGNYVIPGTPLVRLVNIDEVWVEVGVGEKQINEVEKRIAEGKAQDKDKKAYAKFIVPTVGKKEYTGSIEEISPYADPATGSFTLRIKCDNSTHELKGGMFAQVMLPVEARLNTLIVPQSAVIREGSFSYVFVSNSSKAKKVEVKTGVSQNEQVEIEEGLTGDEIIVIDGADLLEEGDAINPRKLDLLDKSKENPPTENK